MAKYIECDAVMQKFADHVKRSNNSDFATVPTWNQAVQIVEDIPAADVVERKHGKWLYEGLIEKTWRVYTCSLCGRNCIDGGSYCPNCGADMREEPDDV